MTDWQKIDTAPRDGTAVLVTFPAEHIGDGAAGMMVAHFDSYHAPGGRGHAGHSGWVDFHCGEACELHYGSPTHWMPLPPPPKEVQP